jgi:hypothetical protein
MQKTTFIVYYCMIKVCELSEYASRLYALSTWCRESIQNISNLFCKTDSCYKKTLLIAFERFAVIEVSNPNPCFYTISISGLKPAYRCFDISSHLSREISSFISTVRTFLIHLEITSAVHGVAFPMHLV